MIKKEKDMSLQSTLQSKVSRKLGRHGVRLDSFFWRDLRMGVQGFVCALFLFVVADYAYRVNSPEKVTIQTTNAEVETTVQELDQLLESVKQYEQQLKERAAYLETALSEAVEMDFHPDITPKADEDLSLGRGSGDGSFRTSPVVSILSDKNPSLEKIDKSLNVIDLVDGHVDRLKSIPIGYPVSEGRISSVYGMRRSPFAKRRWSMHHGVDIAVDRRTKVVASADGVVVSSGRKGAYGRSVKIDHGNGISTVYGHLYRNTVKVGDKVCRGQTIGLVGSTGRSTGPHVHYEVHVDGKPVNPTVFNEMAKLLKLFS